MATRKSVRQHVSSNHGKSSEVVHTVRVTVEGLTGLTLNQNWKGNEETNDENCKPTSDLTVVNNDIEICDEGVQKKKPSKKLKIKKKAIIPKEVVPKVPNPDELCAFITLSRNNTIVGTSNLSETFHRSHDHDVVGTNTSEASDEFEVPNMLDVERYTANWPSTKDTDIENIEDDECNDDNTSSALTGDQFRATNTSERRGKAEYPSNVISFDTKLCRSVTKKGSSNNPTEIALGGGPQYEYAPKSFEIIIGLVEMTNGNDGNNTSSDKGEMQSVFGLPLGVATLAINAQHQELEIPVLSLTQARPTIAVGEVCMPCVEHHQEDSTSKHINIQMGSSNIQWKSSTGSIQPELNGKALKLTKKERRKGRWGIFGSKKRETNKDGIVTLGRKRHNTDKKGWSRDHGPTAQEISTFNMKYSIGSSCKAVLRLKVEIFEKTLDRGKSSKELRHQRKESSRRLKSASADRKHLKAFYELNRSLTPDIALVDASDSDGDLSDYLSDFSDNSDDMSENTGASWDTTSTMSTQGTHGTNFTNTSWNTGLTRDASIGTASYAERSVLDDDDDEDDTTESLRLDQPDDSYDNDDVLSHIEEGESSDDTHVTLNLGGTKLNLFTPNPIHVVCQGSENASWLAEKGSVIGKICNEKVWNWKDEIEEKNICNSANSPQGVDEFVEEGTHRQSMVDKIPQGLAFGERQESFKQSMIDAISCQSSSVCRLKYHTEPIEVNLLSARSMVSLDCDDIRVLQTKGILGAGKQKILEDAKKSSCKNGVLSA